MKPRAEKRTDAGINVYMGPLLYSVDIDENVEIIKDQFKTSVAFPAYNVTLLLSGISVCLKTLK